MPPIVARTTRDVVTVSGPEALTYLQGQASQDLVAMDTGDVAWTFVLQPQGKVAAWARADRAAPDTVRLDVEAGAGAALEARLKRFLLRTDATVTLEADTPVLAVRGAEVIDGVPCGWPGVVGSDVFDPDPAALPSDLPSDAEEVAWHEVDALRIRAGVPAMGAEATDETIPAELGQWVIDASVSFTKGCYTGQELVARIDSRGGNVPRRLVGLVGDGLVVGAAVEHDGEPVGTVTSAADGVGLTLLHRKVEVPATLSVVGATSAVRAVALPIKPSDL